MSPGKQTPPILGSPPPLNPTVQCAEHASRSRSPLMGSKISQLDGLASGFLVCQEYWKVPLCRTGGFRFSMRYLLLPLAEGLGSLLVALTGSSSSVGLLPVLTAGYPGWDLLWLSGSWANVSKRVSFPSPPFILHLFDSLYLLASLDMGTVHKCGHIAAALICRSLQLYPQICQMPNLPAVLETRWFFNSANILPKTILVLLNINKLRKKSCAGYLQQSTLYSQPCAVLSVLHSKGGT